jgi:purine-nucleoside phosphorylase
MGLWTAGANLTGPVLPDVGAVPGRVRERLGSRQMPARLRPTAATAVDAILVGDPGRALMLAQELLQQPKMSNHARGLWGYTGLTHAGRELTVQSTGMGGPSATVVLHDLAELGVRRAVRVGTCTALGDFELGELVLVTEARTPEGRVALPNRELSEAIEGNRRGAVVSLDVLHRHLGEAEVDGEVADMQTAALFEAAAQREISMAALLVVCETNAGDSIDDARLEAAAKRAGAAAATALST